MINRSRGLFFVSDESVFTVEKQYPKLLSVAVGHGGMAVVD
jgi:hypothetical protein